MGYAVLHLEKAKGADSGISANRQYILPNLFIHLCHIQFL